MIAVFIGQDTFRAHEALDALRREIEAGNVGPDSTTQLDATARPDDVLTACQTLPLLGGRRLVIVRDLLGRFEGPRRVRSRGRETAGDPGEPGPLGDWERLLEALPALPESTALAFVDGKISATNPLLQALRQIAEIHQFDELKKAELAAWVRERAERSGARLEPRAIAAMVDLVGSDLWTVDGELRKLATYAGDEPITEEDVRSLVSLVREANVFALADAMIEGRTHDAVALLQRRMADGDAPLRLLALIARQYRLLLLTKELLDGRIRPADIAGRLGVGGFVAQQLTRQAPAYSAAQLRRAYARLLEADLSIKRGVYDERTALELLIFELSATRRDGRPGYSTPPPGRPRTPSAAAKGSSGTR